MFRTVSLSFSLIVLLMVGISFVALQLLAGRMSTAVIEVGDKKLYVQVAKSIGQQYTGLGNRDSLGSYGGMLFPHYPAERIGIVMRDMQFPIDIIWIRSGTIVDIAPNVPIEPGVPEHALHKYYPRADADLVLEAAAGFTAQYGVEIGDTVRVIEQ
jgi:uncharacterized membrane protein (UPF0127 family)